MRLCMGDWELESWGAWSRDMETGGGKGELLWVLSLEKIMSVPRRGGNRLSRWVTDVASSGTEIVFLLEERISSSDANS